MLYRGKLKVYKPDEIRQDASLGHRIVAKNFGILPQKKNGVMSDSNILWSLKDSHIIVQSTQQGKDMEPYEIDYQATRLDFSSTLMRKKVISLPQEMFDAGYRTQSKRVTVEDGDREDFIGTKLEEQGFYCDWVNVSDLQKLHVGRGHKSYTVPYFDICAVGKVVSEDKFANLMKTGIGRSRCYGLGLITPSHN